MRTRENSNNYPYWLYRLISTDVVSPEVIQPFQTLPSENFVLNYLYVQFPTIGGVNPTTFRDIRFLLEIPQQNKQYVDVPVSLDMVTSPGKFEPFTGGISNPNEQFFKSKRLEQPILCQQIWNLKISNYLGVGNPTWIKVLFIGRNIFKRGRKS